jgi:hypothetical protein
MLCRRHPALVAAGAVLVVLLVGCPVTVKVKQEPVKAMRADYFELVSLREQPDETHTIALADLKGRTWYREPEAGIDLRHLDANRALVIKVGEGEYELDLTVREEGWQRLGEWSRERLERPVGVIMDGQLVFADRLHGPLSSRLLIPGLKTAQEAQFYADGIKNLGMTDSVFERIEFDSQRPDVPVVLIQRYPRCPIEGEEIVAGPIAAVWSDGRLIRIASEEQIGRAYVAGKLQDDQMQRLKRLIERSRALTEGNGGVAAVDAAAELLCVWHDGKVARYAESVFGAKNPMMAQVRQYLVSTELRDEKPTPPPWRVPPEEWCK